MLQMLLSAAHLGSALISRNLLQILCKSLQAFRILLNLSATSSISPCFLTITSSSLGYFFSLLLYFLVSPLICFLHFFFFAASPKKSFNSSEPCNLHFHFLSTPHPSHTHTHTPLHSSADQWRVFVRSRW